jgi:hypothetical protein
VRDEQPVEVDDGLPLGPEQRRAAIAEQFADFEVEIDALTTRPTVPTEDAGMSAAEYDARLKRWQNAILDLARREEYPGSVDVVIAGLDNVSDALKARAVTIEPATLAILLSHADHRREGLRLIGEAAGRDATAVQH